MKRVEFYRVLRETLYSQGLPQVAVTNTEIILNEIERAVLPIQHAAYVLATAYHEVGANMAPVRENLNYTRATQIAKTWPKRFTVESAKAFVGKPQELAEAVYGKRADLGNTEKGDGWTYRGGGYPQCTGRANYAKFGKLLGVPLEKIPSIILQPDIAAQVLVQGMEDGLFTGKKLADYGNGKTAFDAVSARAIVNGDVKANGAKIALYAGKYLRALTAAGYGTGAPSVPVAPPMAPKPAKSSASVPAWAIGGGAVIAAGLFALAKFFN